MSNSVLLSPADDRDYPVTAALDISSDPIPEDFEVWQPPTIEAQIAEHCVAQVLANIMECIEYRRSGKHKDFSVGYIYGTPLNTAYATGMYSRDGFKSLLKEGDVLREEWECYDENPLCREKRIALPKEIHDKAQRLIRAYIRINSKEEMQRYMLRYKLPVMIAAKASDYWALAGSGYHAVTCYGWRSKNTLDREYKDLKYTNSWGALNAKGLIQYEKITEVWGVIPMEDFKPTDIAGHWSEKDAMYLVERGIIKGYEDGTIRPDAPITRAEVFTMLTRILKGE